MDAASRRLLLVGAAVWLAVTALALLQPSVSPEGVVVVVALSAGLLVLATTTWLIAERHWRGRMRAVGDFVARLADSQDAKAGAARLAAGLPEVDRAIGRLGERLSVSLTRLKQERDRFARILDGMQEGVLVLDGAGRVAVVNPALRRMLLLASEVVGRTALEAIRNAELKRAIDEAQSSGEAVADLELGDLKPRRLLVHLTRLPGGAGLVAVFVDVTEMRRLETVRRDFVANVSHELRTPIAAVRAAAETLRAVLHSEPTRADEFLAIVERNAERLLRLVEDLLDLSRIESREYRLSPQPLDVVGVVLHVLALARPRAEAKHIELTHGGGGSPCQAWADRRALEQVLANLVDNAVKYCPAGSHVRVAAELDEALVRVTVEDDGPGIEARHLPRLFERFYRVDAGRSRDEGGTGLGLSIVKHLVEAMGGAVGVDSRPGRGTVFSITLPARSP